MSGLWEVVGNCDFSSISLSARLWSCRGGSYSEFYHLISQMVLNTACAFRYLYIILFKLGRLIVQQSDL